MCSVSLEDSGLQDVPDVLACVERSHLGGEEPVEDCHGIQDLHPHHLVHHQAMHLGNTHTHTHSKIHKNNEHAHTIFTALPMS